MELGQGVNRRVPALERGYAMAALLVGLSIMGVLMSMALPVWSHFTRREREEELIWRGQQYARAVMLFQRKYANTFPPTIDILVEQRFLRKKYKDPITNDDFQPIPVGGGTSPANLQPPPAGGGNQTPPPQGGLALQQRTGPGGAATLTLTQQPALGIQGVVSKSTATSIKTYNGRTKYSEWVFVNVATTQRIGPGAAQQPGVPPGSRQSPGASQRGGTTFTPMGGVDRRPGINPATPFPTAPGGFPPGMNPGGPPPGMNPGGFPPGGGQFPQQPSPFRPPTPFGQPGQQSPPPRPPGT